MLYGIVDNRYAWIQMIRSGLQIMVLSMGLLAHSAEASQSEERYPSGADAKAIAELRQNTQALMDAVAPGDVSVWKRLLDDRAIQTDENNIVRNKAQMLAELKPLPAGLVGHLSIADFRVVRRGDVAVASHEDDEFLDYHGQVIRSRFRMTDTWVHRPEGWRQLGSQVLAVLQDPPSRELAAKLTRSIRGDLSIDCRDRRHLCTCGR